MRTRREILQSGIGLTVMFSTAGIGGCDRERDDAKYGREPTELVPNAWVNIAPSGIITIMAPADEMGQGSMTALPLILAEELDAEWDDVRIEMSPSIDGIYGNPEFGGLIYTAMSTAVLGYYDRLRLIGAETRQLLLMNVALHWDASLSQLTTAPSVVVDSKNDRRISYGEIVRFAYVPAHLPTVTKADLKSPEKFRLIGHSVPRRDVADKVNGKSQYAMDVAPPNSVYAAVARSPVWGAELLSVDATKAKTVPGVLHVLQSQNAVTIAADNYPSALAARRRLDVKWTRVAGASDYDSSVSLDYHRQLAADVGQTGRIWDQGGTLPDDVGAAEQTLTAEYQSDYLYHAQMETLNSVVSVDNANNRVEAWVGTQAPTQTIRAIARVTGIAEENILLHRMMLGGAFGRRSVSEMDFVVDAAVLSQDIGRPVKMVWSREDDVGNGWFKPMTAHWLRAALNSDGRVSAWRHRVAVQEPLATAEPGFFQALEEEPVVSMRGAEQPFYDFTDHLVEHLSVEPGIRTYPLLGVGVTPNKFAVESFIDELAASVQSDPVEFRLKLLNRSPRAQRILEAVAEMSDWGTYRRDVGRERGIAFVDYHGSVLAGCAEISLSRESGKIHVHNFWAAIDPGVAVQPDNIVSQLQGSIVFGLGGALTERITFSNGVAQQSNFDDYTLMRINDVPNIFVKVLPNGESPSAVGQTGATLVAPAINNAFVQLTGKRLRHMPFIPERVRRVLNTKV